MVSLIVGTTCLSKVFMDGGSGLNILCACTLDRMKITQNSFRLNEAPFFEVILGKETMLLRCIGLNVKFGQPDNFWKEPLTFKVVDFPGTYHALLRWPCFAQFIAVPLTPT